MAVAPGRQIGDILNLSIADPTQMGRQIRITLSGRYAGGGGSYVKDEHKTTLAVDLPAEMFAGQSVQRVLHAV